MSLQIESLLIHGGVDGDVTTGAVNVPVFQTSTFKQDGLGKTRGGWEYARSGNPTRDAVEKLIADLEHAKYGLAFATGLAAINTVLSLFKSGDKLVVSDNIYGGTFRILDNVFNNFGITYTIVDTSDLKAVEAAIDENVKAIYVESPANPLLTVTDLKAVSDIAHRHGLLSIVDKIVNILKSYRESYKFVHDSDFLSCFCRNRRMCHRSRMAYKRFHSAEALSQSDKL